MDYLLAFLKAPELANWLNNWNDIEDEMEQIDCNRDEITIHTFLIYFIPLYEFVPLLILASYETVLRLDPVYPIHCVLIIIYGYLPSISYALGDSMALIFLKCLQVEFRQVCELRWKRSNDL